MFKIIILVISDFEIFTETLEKPEKVRKNVFLDGKEDKF